MLKHKNVDSLPEIFGWLRLLLLDQETSIKEKLESLCVPFMLVKNYSYRVVIILWFLSVISQTLVADYHCHVAHLHNQLPHWCLHSP